MRLPLGQWLARTLRDLRISLMLGVLTLLPTAAPAHMTAPLAADAEAGDPAATTNVYIVHVPGIAGPMGIDRRLAEGLVAGGAASEVEIFDWVGRRRGLGAVFGIDENRSQARRLAGHLLDLKRANPDRPLVVLAHSGGTAIVAWALELLPEIAAEQAQQRRGGQAVDDTEDGSARDVSTVELPIVDGVVMLASGLSGAYDLSPMLRQVRGSVFHLSSAADNFILGAGTMLFGTLDRKHGLAAGKTGFFLPPGVEAEAYARFIEVPYDRAWADMGHFGDHEGMMSVRFGATIVADLVRASRGEPVKLPTTRAASPAPIRAAVGDGSTPAATRPTSRATVTTPSD